MKMMSEIFSKCSKDLSQNLTIGLNLKFPAKTLQQTTAGRNIRVVPYFQCNFHARTTVRIVDVWVTTQNVCRSNSDSKDHTTG
jgi:hypothetical protein